MSEETPVPDSAKSGGSTSEFKLSAAVVVLGTIFSGIAATLGALQEYFPDAAWISIAAGLLAAAAAVLGYSQSRGKVKVADILATAAKAIANSAGPSAGMAVLGASTPAPPSTPILSSTSAVTGGITKPNP